MRKHLFHSSATNSCMHVPSPLLHRAALSSLLDNIVFKDYAQNVLLISDTNQFCPCAFKGTKKKQIFSLSSRTYNKNDDKDDRCGVGYGDRFISTDDTISKDEAMESL